MKPPILTNLLIFVQKDCWLSAWVHIPGYEWFDSLFCFHTMVIYDSPRLDPEYSPQLKQRSQPVVQRYAGSQLRDEEQEILSEDPETLRAMKARNKQITKARDYIAGAGILVGCASIVTQVPYWFAKFIVWAGLASWPHAIMMGTLETGLVPDPTGVWFCGVVTLAMVAAVAWCLTVVWTACQRKI